MKTFTRSSASILSLIFFLLLLIFSGCRKTGPYSLTLTVRPDGAGTITADPAAENEYEQGASVTLTEQPGLSYYFSGWEGDASGNDNPLTIIMNGDKVIEASYAKGFYEDFEDGDADYIITDSHSCWAITDHALVMTGTKDEGPHRYGCYNYNLFDNFEFSVKLGGDLNGYDSGFFFRSQTSDLYANSYQLCIVPNGSWLLIKWKDNSPSAIQDYVSSNNLNTGTGSTNTVKVICTGTSIQVVFNNVSQGTYTDTDFSAGYAGVWASDFTNTAVFDNLFLKEI